uniref:Putative hemocyanin subunit n=1 Tax=Tityus obscurus TaxID=1221240 RepID=A0A1E1WVS7_TITOB
MVLHERQIRILKLFKHLSLATVGGGVPRDQRDSRLADLTLSVRPGEIFSCFHPDHLEDARHLYEIFYEAKDFNDFVHLAQEARTFVNEGLFAFAAEVAVLYRPDCKGLSVPPIQQIFPERFVPSATLAEIINKASTKPAGDESPILVDVKDTGNIFDPEYNLAYFREDIGINAHHWHWHLVYPATWNASYFGKEKDRKGELFYYMHQQMCARYDCERLSNGLNRMIPFHNFDEELEGYAPHLSHLSSGRYYAPRPAGLRLSDLKDVDVQEMERWRERIIDAIHLGHIEGTDGKEIALDEEHGADILGDLIESSYESKNPVFYGSLHNMGHVMMARIHDPDGRFQETLGVMSDTSTSLRDPIFYRWHRFIDNIFQDYKATLPVYTKDQLHFAGVEVTDIHINARIPNVIDTFMLRDELEMSYGFIFGSDGSYKARYQHLDHEHFSYTINVQSTLPAKKEATVRIFLAPKYDELGNIIPPNELRRLCIEMDKFKTELTPGINTVVRNSVDSSVALSREYTFEELERGDGITEDRTEYCSCGWPQHLLVPKGNPKGMVYYLFVMLTDRDQDKVTDGAGDHSICSDAVSYCGAKDDKYPDKKSMGYPFDRPLHYETLEGFLTKNMHVREITVKFHP